MACAVGEGSGARAPDVAGRNAIVRQVSRRSLLVVRHVSVRQVSRRSLHVVSGYAFAEPFVVGAHDLRVQRIGSTVKAFERVSVRAATLGICMLARGKP
jgi:hypothetical protein